MCFLIPKTTPDLLFRSPACIFTPFWLKSEVENSQKESLLLSCPVSGLKSWVDHKDRCFICFAPSGGLCLKVQHLPFQGQAAAEPVRCCSRVRPWGKRLKERLNKKEPTHLSWRTCHKLQVTESAPSTLTPQKAGWPVFYPWQHLRWLFFQTVSLFRAGLSPGHPCTLPSPYTPASTHTHSACAHTHSPHFHLTWGQDSLNACTYTELSGQGSLQHQRALDFRRGSIISWGCATLDYGLVFLPPFPPFPLWNGDSNSDDMMRWQMYI